jgi:hypothetical protein
MKTKPILCPHRLRHVPRQFSWIDQRLIRDGHIRGRTTAALAFYLFLCTVADAQGASYYSDGRVCEFLGLDSSGLNAARQELINAGLVAYSSPFYQVLSLDAHKIERPKENGSERPPQERVGEMQSISQILVAMMEGRA